MLARRARLRRLAGFGQRAGYGLYAGSLACGAVGIRWGYTPALSTLIAVALVVGSMLLAPAIVMSHGIKAAEREEREAAAHDPSAGADTDKHQPSHTHHPDTDEHEPSDTRDSGAEGHMSSDDDVNTKRQPPGDSRARR